MDLKLLVLIIFLAITKEKVLSARLKFVVIATRVAPVLMAAKVKMVKGIDDATL